jgi:hypothetical protein
LAITSTNSFELCSAAYRIGMGVNSEMFAEGLRLLEGALANGR